MIESAAIAAFLDYVQFQAVIGMRMTGDGVLPWFWSSGLPAGCASSQLDRSLPFYTIREGCASSQLITKLSDSIYRLEQKGLDGTE